MKIYLKFREIADKVGAYLFVDMAHVAGLIAAGVYPSPVPFVFLEQSLVARRGFAAC